MNLTVGFASLRSWLTERLTTVDVRTDTRAYLVGVMSERLRHEDGALTGKSIVLAYSNAQAVHSFAAYQAVGDEVLWLGSTFPDEFNRFGDVYSSFGRLSYYACYRLIGGAWPLYEQLADELPRIALETSRAIITPGLKP